MRVVGIIPARLRSTRLPGKLLLAETGRPLIQHTWEATRQAKSLSEVIVAADDTEIVAAVRKFGGRCELTGEHPSGTDRVAEVVRRCCSDADIIVNIQGDEPEIDPASIDLLVSLMKSHPDSAMATLATPIRTREQWLDPSCVKVVCGNAGQALYFSRCPIPFCRDRDPDELLATDSPWRLHLGIYAYRREFLLRLTTLPPSRLEQLEKLEQLRVLEAGETILVGEVAHRSVGIDTPEDYARFVVRQRGRAAA
jgi:3-deoxy-manno-octulosonate cytidylyltransferase (CMP-KDO synthetase)